MTTSNSATRTFDLMEMIEEAYEQAGVQMVQSGNDLRSAHRSLDLLTSEWANRGINLWTVEEASVPLVEGSSAYNLPEDTVDLIDYYIRMNAGDSSSQRDIKLTRIGHGSYAAISNKLSSGRPNSIFIERLRDQPIARLWPVPDGQQEYILVYYRLRRIQDAGRGQYTNTMDAPFRFIPALVTGLAYQVAKKRSQDFNRINFLQQEYIAQLELAQAEDSSRTELRIYPDIGYRW